MDLLLARNPDGDSSLPYLMLVPLGDGLVFRAKDTWPRTSAIYCHPVPRTDWPLEPELVETVPLRSCARRGAAIDLIADRGREQRSQLVFTTAKGREVVFWQAPRTRKQARPAVRVPTARAAGLSTLEILVDAHERYPYRFDHQQVTTRRAALRCGDYGVEVDGVLAAAVERKSLSDLTTSLTSGKLRYALSELAALPRAAVVVEDRYSQVFAQEFVRPAVVADGLAELAVRWPNVPVIFAETRPLAQEWAYRFLAAAAVWLGDEAAAQSRVAGPTSMEVGAPIDLPAEADRGTPSEAATAVRSGTEAASRLPSTAEVRLWAAAHGLPVADRGRLRPEILAAWRSAHPDH